VDIAWDDPDGDDDETDEPITCHEQTARYLTAVELGSAPTWAESCTNPSRTSQPLRC
jgi:hypothetical protein